MHNSFFRLSTVMVYTAPPNALPHVRNKWQNIKNCYSWRKTIHGLCQNYSSAPIRIVQEVLCNRLPCQSIVYMNRCSSYSRAIQLEISKHSGTWVRTENREAESGGSTELSLTGMVAKRVAFAQAILLFKRSKGKNKHYLLFSCQNWSIATWQSQGGSHG